MTDLVHLFNHLCCRPLELATEEAVGTVGPTNNRSIGLGKQSERRKYELGTTHLQDDGVSEETVYVFLTLPPVVENGNVELGVVGLAGAGAGLVADECGEGIEAIRGGFKGFDIVHNLGEALTAQPVAGAGVFAAHTITKLQGGEVV